MAVSGDLSAQNFSTVQTAAQPLPPTIASAATIAPVHKLTFVTGTTQVATITPPVNGYCEISLCFTNAAPGAFLTTGNIQIAYQPVQNRPIDLCYDPSSAKWWVKAVV
jgi:hypothetical protein